MCERWRYIYKNEEEGGEREEKRGEQEEEGSEREEKKGEGEKEMGESPMPGHFQVKISKK